MLTLHTLSLATVAVLLQSVALVHGQMLPPDHPTVQHLNPNRTLSPSPAAGVEFVSVEGQKLFVSDGYFARSDNLVGPRDQFYSLDLSIPWKASAPAWAVLAGKPQTEGEPNRLLAMSRDNSTLMLFDTQTRGYDIKKNAWTAGQSPNMSYAFSNGAFAGVDSGVYYGLGAMAPPFVVTTFDANKNTYTNATAEGGPLSAQGLGLVYNDVRKSILGYPSNSTNLADLWEYSPSTNKWTTLTTKGDIPSRRGWPCLTSAQRGSKLVLMGGQSMPAVNDTNLALNDLYLLDIATLTWKKLANAPKSYYSSACAASGDHLILWGGYSTYKVNPKSLWINGDDGGVDVYNFMSDTWGQDYSPLSSDDKAKGGDGPGSAGNVVTKVAPWMGVVVAAMAVLLV